MSCAPGLQYWLLPISGERTGLDFLPVQSFSNTLEAKGLVRQVSG